MNTIYNHIRILILSLSIVCVPEMYAQLQAPHYYFTGFDISNGLSQNTVTSIIQDSKGFMWFGTKDGLNRFYGLTFRIFKHGRDNKNSIGNNFISSLYEDNDGLIWVGTDDGLYIYYPERESFEYFTRQSQSGSIIEKNISMIGGDKQGRIWIAVESQGLFCYDKKSDTLHNHTFDVHGINSNINCFLIDESGTIWLGFYRNGLYYSKDGLKTISPFTTANGTEPFRDDVIAKIAQGAYNCIYVGGVKNGIKELNLTTGNARDLLQQDENGEHIYVRRLVTLSDNELGVATETGVYIYNICHSQRDLPAFHLAGAAERAGV